MGNFSYTKWITPLILFFFFMVCLGYWTHKLHHASHPAPVSAPSQK
jgi:hypothetical protein